MSINKLPKEVRAILPEIMQAIPVILSGSWLGQVMIPAIVSSRELQMIKENPEWKAIALQEIENEFGKEAEKKLISIFRF